MSGPPFPFALRQRVRFGETDMQGVVYYANYLVYAEAGRFAYLERLGLSYAELLARGVDFTIGEASVRYRTPLRFPDEYDVRVRGGDVRRVSWTLEYAVDRADGARAADAQTVQVFIDRHTFKAKRLPDDLRAILEGGRGPA